MKGKINVSFSLDGKLQHLFSISFFLILLFYNEDEN